MNRNSVQNTPSFFPRIKEWWRERRALRNHPSLWSLGQPSGPRLGPRGSALWHHLQKRLLTRGNQIISIWKTAKTPCGNQWCEKQVMGTLHFRSLPLPPSPRLSLLHWLGPCPPDFPASSPYSSCFLSSLLPRLGFWRTQNNLWAFIIPFLNFRIKWKGLNACFPPPPKKWHIFLFLVLFSQQQRNWTAGVGGSHPWPGHSMMAVTARSSALLTSPWPDTNGKEASWSNQCILYLSFWKHPEPVAMCTGEQPSQWGMRPNVALLSRGSNLREENCLSTMAPSHTPQPQTAPENTQ